MKESWSEILWNEEIRRRCGVVDIVEKVREARLRWCEHVIRRYEGEPGWIKWNEVKWNGMIKVTVKPRKN